jgi:DUF1680 family protein
MNIYIFNRSAIRWTVFQILIFFLASCNSSLTSENKDSGSSQLKVFPSKDVSLTDSWIKQREDLNRDFLYRLEPDRLLHNFRINAGIPSSAKPLEGWEHPQCGLRGHFVGHYLSACATMIEKDSDSTLQSRINYMVNILAECQQKLGGKYLSAFPEKDFDTLETKFGGVWAPYYTYHKIMQGLLDVSTKTGNAKAYQIVLGMADYVAGRMQKLSAETIDKVLYTPQANPSNEAGGMNEVLQNLYAVTKDPKHLELARLFDRDWFFKPLFQNKDILSGLHSNTHVVLVNGFARRFENTHDSEYSTAVLNFWEMLYNHHCYVNGSSSGPRPIASTPTSQTAEHWGVADHLSTTFTSQIAESCVTHNTQKLASNLFRWTGSPIYADAYMNTFYNAVLASQNEETGATVYHLPLGSPSIKAFLTDNDFRCCNGSAIEAFSKLNQNIYFHNEDDIWVNLYIPSRLDWREKGIKLEERGKFPEDNSTQFVISCEKPIQFGLKLFIPSWATGSNAIKINGQIIKQSAKPSSYFTIEREWENGDSIELDFSFSFQLKEMPDDKNVVAIYYGPVLLAFETKEEIILKGTYQNIVDGLTKQNDEFSFILKNGTNGYRLRPFYKIKNDSFGVYATIRNEY